MKKIFKGIRKKEQGNRFVTEDIKRHTEDDSPKYLQTQNYVITRTNRAECGAVCQNDRLSAGHIWQTRSHVYGEVKCQTKIQRDVVIPNKLDHGETCHGLLRRFVHKITNNNESSPHNDMNNKILNQVQNDVKNVKNLFPYFPIYLSLKKKIAFTLAEGATHVDLPPTKVKFAFTLAEVLITLGIIGIVAAMTIPTLITNYHKKQTVTKLQKAISVLNQAYKLSYDDVGEPSITESYNIGSDEYFKTYWAPYIKTSLFCTSYEQCGYKEAFPWHDLNNNVIRIGVVVNNRRATFYTPDGFLYVIFTASGPAENLLADSNVFVDINGGTGPNVIGKDLFILQRVQEDGGGIRPFGGRYSNSALDVNCSKNGNGYGCAEKIRRAGWKIEKDYPWN